MINNLLVIHRQKVYGLKIKFLFSLFFTKSHMNLSRVLNSYAIFYFICFHLWEKGEKTEKFFLFFGTHSTNIWLLHMFFYLYIFKDLVFVVKYPVFIYLLMIGICTGCSYIINFILKIMWKSKPFQRLDRFYKSNTDLG